MEKKDLYNAIWKRKSVRKYLDKQIEKSKVDAVRESISSLNEISGLTMEFIEDGGSFRSVLALMFKNVRSVIVLKGKTDDPYLYEKCGYYGEQIVLEATVLGLGTCWVMAFNKKCDSLKGADETVACTITVGYGAEGMSESTKVPLAPHRKTRSISDFLNGNTKVPEWVTSAMKAVQFAPSARNSQKVRFDHADGKLSAKIPDGRMNMIDLGIAKFHFELAAGGVFELGSPGEFRKN